VPKGRKRTGNQEGTPGRGRIAITTKTPHQSGLAVIEKIMVGVLADIEPFSTINMPEFISGASDIIKPQHIDI
jgi:hypothetical protein